MSLLDTVIRNAQIVDYADQKCVDYPSLNAEQANLCEALKIYRDTVLVEDYNDLVKKYLFKREIVSDLEGVKNALIDSNKWLVENGDGVTQILVMIKRTCNLIEILVPATKANRAVLESYRFYQLYRKYGKGLQDFATTGISSFKAIDEKLRETLELINVIYAVAKELKEWIEEAERLNKEWKDYRTTVDSLVNQLKSSIRIYDDKVREQFQAVIDKGDYQGFIDSYLRINCSSESNSSKVI